MKFSCDSCHAQYMISDEKVGAAGVRVRCKKCGNVIHVKRVEADAPPQEDATVVMTADKLAQIQDQLNAARGIGPDGAPSPPKVTADEIGQAFDSMFSEHTAEDGSVQPPGASAPPVAIAAPPPPENDPDRAETRVLTAGDIQRIATDLAPPAPPAVFETEKTVAAPYTRAPSKPGASTEWFVAIREEQVGPLTPAGVKERWEHGEVGPDTLVWCSGLPDWKPLSSVDELAQLVAPAPTATVRNGAGSIAPTSPSKAPPAPGPDDFKPEDSLAEFKPSAASALASLASMAQEEMDAAERAKAAPKPPEPEPAAAPAVRSSSSRADLFADLPPPEAAPAAPPVAVTAANSFGAPVPVPDVYQAPMRRGAEPAFGRPSIRESSNVRTIALVSGVLVLVLVVALTLIWALVLKPQKDAQDRRIAELAAAAAATKNQPPPAPAPVAAPTPAPAPAPVAPTGAVAAAAAKPPVVPAPAAPAEDRKHRPGRHHEHGHEESAAATPSAPAAATPTAAAGSGGNGDGFLDTGPTKIDKEFERELNGDGSDGTKSAAAAPHHQVYIPPPPGQSDLPQTLGQSDIMEVIVEHKGSFARCKTDHPGTSGTIVMHWRIKPDGHTADVKRSGGDIDNAPLANCIKSAVSKLKFGAYRGPPMAPIDFPFSL